MAYPDDIYTAAMQPQPAKAPRKKNGVFDPNPAGGYAPGALGGTRYDVAAPGGFATPQYDQGGNFIANPQGGYAPGALGGTQHNVSAPAPSQPSQSAPRGTQPIPGDWSLQDPGALEGAWSEHGDWFFGPSASSAVAWGSAPTLMQPSAAQQYWSGIEGNFAGPTNSQGYYDTFQAPEINYDAGLDPYYARQRDTTGDAINRAFAARGGFGSSAATDTIADAMVGLGAEQANREGDYYLRALGEDRLWNALGGDLARTADTANQGLMAIGGNVARLADLGETGRISTLGTLASQGDYVDLAKRSAGMTGASNAQVAREGRVRGAYQDLFNQGAAIGNTVGGGIFGALGGDEQLLDAYLSFLLGGTSEGKNQDYRTRESILSDAGAIAATVGNTAVAGGPQGFGVWGGPPTQPTPPPVTDPNAPGFWR